MLKPRKSLLNILVNFSEPIHKINKALSDLDWDSEELVTLESKHIVSVLERYLLDHLTTNDVEEWANSLEMRDDVRFDSNEGLLIEIIFELVNPELMRALNKNRANELLRLLNS